MANNAHITLYGNVMLEPKTSQWNNQTIMNLKVSVQTTKKQENSQYPATDVYDVTVWGRSAEALSNKVKAKSRVLIIGDFMTGDIWQDRNGNNHPTLKVTANSVTILGDGGNYSGNRNYNNSSAPASVAADEEPPF